EVDLVLVRVNPDPAEDEEPRLLLADEGQDLLEALAVEERDGQLDPRLRRELAPDLEVRLVDLGQARVDDLLVELLLLLEAEDLRRLLAQHANDAVEHRVVEIRVVDGHGLKRPARRLADSAARLRTINGVRR